MMAIIFLLLMLVGLCCLIFGAVNAYKKIDSNESHFGFYFDEASNTSKNYYLKWF